MKSIQTIALVALGGAVGSVCRYVLGGFVQRTSHLAFPVGTLAVNVAGCLVVGLVAGAISNYQVESPTIRALLIVGFCGGFTTFSAFSLETMGLISGGELTKATLYVGASVLACLVGTGLGWAIGRQLGA